MKYTIQFERNVLLDFKSHKAYYNHISQKLGTNFDNEFWQKIDYIKNYPLHHRVRYRSIRIAILKIYPFGIHFIIEGDTILILKLLHFKQFYK